LFPATARRRLPRRLGYLLFGLIACSRKPGATTRACGQVPCEDGFTATVLVSKTSIPTGLHRVDMTVDGTELSCAFEYPPKAPGSDPILEAECQPGLKLALAPATTCSTGQRASGAGPGPGPCVRIGEQLAESITVKGTPRAVGVTQSVEGRPFLERFFAPVYEVINPNGHPNGSGCDRSCRQASASWTLR
jgi:hypothetical protein